jgi:hypothetical protein
MTAPVKVVYSPKAGVNRASSAYAIACGTTTRPTVIPAMTSPSNQCRLYRRIHCADGNSSLTYSATPCEEGTKPRNHSATEGSSSRYVCPMVSLASCSIDAVFLRRPSESSPRTLVMRNSRTLSLLISSTSPECQLDSKEYRG